MSSRAPGSIPCSSTANMRHAIMRYVRNPQKQGTEERGAPSQFSWIKRRKPQHSWEQSMSALTLGPGNSALNSEIFSAWANTFSDSNQTADTVTTPQPSSRMDGWWMRHASGKKLYTILVDKRDVKTILEIFSKRKRKSVLEIHYVLNMGWIVHLNTTH
jgi:hypothetical protein